MSRIKDFKKDCEMDTEECDEFEMYEDDFDGVYESHNNL